MPSYQVVKRRRWLPIVSSALFAAVAAGCASTTMNTSINPDDYVWPTPPERTRLTYVMSLSSAEDLEEKKSSLTDRILGEAQTGDSGPALIKPYGVHADREGRIFVTDTALGKVVVFDVKRKKVSVWGDRGRGFLSKPIGVTSDSAGRVYVTDVIGKRLVIFDSNGSYVGESSADADFKRPAGVVVDENKGEVYVADSKRHQIVVLDMNGKLVRYIGERGDGPSQFNIPTNLALDSHGQLNVVDSMNHRVQILNEDGEMVESFGDNNDAPGGFSRPRGIGVDSDGNIYVADAAFSNFQIFNQKGELLLFVGKGGNQPGEFLMPAGVYIDAQDQLYVVDQFNHRVQVFQYHPE